MTNLQDGVDILGDLPLLNQTYYSIELYAEHFVPDRNYTVNFYQEEDIFWREDEKEEEGYRWDWVVGRQEMFHLIETPALGEVVQEVEL